MDALHKHSILLLFSTLFVFMYSVELINEENKRTVNMNYDIILEPRMENCTEPMELSSVKNIRFKKIDRRILSVSSLIELKKQVEQPLKVLIYIEILQQGSYVFYIEVPCEDICTELENDKDEKGIFSTYAHRFDVYSCPLKMGFYNTTNFTVDLDQVPLGPQHVGRYRIKVLLSGMIEGKMQDFYCQVYFTRVDRERTRG